jgi:uncharacterized protein
MALDITLNEPEHRYEAHVDGELAGFAVFRMRGDRIVFTHTEVDDRFEGQGVGSKLARHALDDVRERGSLQVVPQCPFIRSWIEKHPEYADLVSDDERSRTD